MNTKLFKIRMTEMTVSMLSHAITEWIKKPEATDIVDEIAEVCDFAEASEVWGTVVTCYLHQLSHRLAIADAETLRSVKAWTARMRKLPMDARGLFGELDEIVA